MANKTTYELADSVATITMDDRKVNALGLEMLGELHAAFDRAESDGAAVLLTGRDGMFTAGFDLKVFAAGGRPVLDMLEQGATLAERILTFPLPTVIATPGHAIAAGTFLLLAADVRLGAAGPFRIGLNEVEIGLTMPWFVVELARYRLSPSALDAAVVQATMYDPEGAVAAGYLDRVVAGEELRAEAVAAVGRLQGLNANAFKETKQRVREPGATALRAAIEKTMAELETALAGG